MEEMDARQCPGFVAGSVAAGLKKNGEKDLGVIFSTAPASAAGVFTTNLVQAAPVTLDRERIRSGACRAVVANSGCANCCTGDQGMRNAAATARLMAASLDVPEQEVLVASTGVIGRQLEMDKIEPALPRLVSALSADGFADFARSIMTTDKVPKIASQRARASGKDFTVLGMAKGAGMIRPDMATMLCFVCTDMGASAPALQQTLQRSVDGSFNRITVDGDTSTNDTVLVLANGLSGLSIEQCGQAFQEALDAVLLSLARAIVRDGEGATKLVTVLVKGARTAKEARAVAETIAHSNLVKTAFFGEDANWGRVLAAAGRAGVPMDPEKVDLFFDRVCLVRSGTWCGDKAEAESTAVLKKPEFILAVDLKAGNESFRVYTCDLSVDYVRINAHYRS